MGTEGLIYVAAESVPRLFRAIRIEDSLDEYICSKYAVCVCFLNLHKQQYEMLNVIFSTVHYSIDLFHLPTLMHNSFIH